MNRSALKDWHQGRSIAVLLFLALAACFGFVVNDVLQQSNASQAVSLLEPWLLPEALLTDPVNGGLSVDLRELDLGDVGESDSFEWELTLINPTESEIRIEDFQVRCSQHIRNPTIAIRPGDKAVLRGSLNLTPRDGGSLERIRPIENRIVPIIGGRLQQGWQFRGRTHRVFAINPRFTNGLRREGALMVALLRPDVEVEVECDPAIAEVEIERWRTIERRPVYEVRATPTAPISPESIRVTIRSTPFEGMRASVGSSVRIDLP